MVEKKILLFRSKLEETLGDDIYEKLLQDHGYHVKTISPIAFHFINQDILSVKLETNKYDGLIFTSKRAVDAVQQVLTDEHRQRYQRIYVEGPATGNLVRRIFDSSANVLGDECGGSESLANLIVQEAHYLTSPMHLLFLCAQSRLDALPKRLSNEAKIHFEELPVYETIPSKSLDEELHVYLQNYGRPDILGFFSPSGFDSFLKACQRIDFDLNSKLPVFISLGKTTSTTIRERLQSVLFVEHTCSKPTPEEFLETVKSINT